MGRQGILPWLGPNQRGAQTSHLASLGSRAFVCEMGTKSCFPGWGERAGKAWLRAQPRKGPTEALPPLVSSLGPEGGLGGTVPTPRSYPSQGAPLSGSPSLSAPAHPASLLAPAVPSVWAACTPGVSQQSLRWQPEDPPKCSGGGFSLGPRVGLGSALLPQRPPPSLGVGPAGPPPTRAQGLPVGRQRNRDNATSSQTPAVHQAPRGALPSAGPWESVSWAKGRLCTDRDKCFLVFAVTSTLLTISQSVTESFAALGHAVFPQSVGNGNRQRTPQGRVCVCARVCECVCVSVLSVIVTPTKPEGDGCTSASQRTGRGTEAQREAVTCPKERPLQEPGSPESSAQNWAVGSA